MAASNARKRRSRSNSRKSLPRSSGQPPKDVKSLPRSSGQPPKDVTWADRRQANATLWAAILAGVAIIVTIAIFMAQHYGSQSEYSSRVAVGKLNMWGDFTIENRSTATLTFANLEYIAMTDSLSERTKQIFRQSRPGVFLTAVPPCTRLEFDARLVSRKILGAAEVGEVIAGRPELDSSDYDRFFAFVTHIVFTDQHGRWSVPMDGTGSEKSKAEVYGAPMEPIDPQISKSTTISDCGPG
jgi:hypothetical protein